MAVAALPMAGTCPDCAGTGAINGAECYGCHGARFVRRRRRWSLRKSARRALEAVATPAGYVVGSLTSLPGIGGAGSLAYGTAWVAHDVWHPLPLWGVFMVAAGAFGLLLDRRL